MIGLAGGPFKLAFGLSGAILNLELMPWVGAGNNGNVWAITNNRDTTRSQSFTYDQLNRLISAQNAGTDCTKNTLNGKTEYWANTYAYDAWGNLTTRTRPAAEPKTFTSIPTLTTGSM